jgi:hypothetical protein
MRTVARLLVLAGFCVAVLDLPSASSQTVEPTTESICNFGMAKNEPGQRCEVPIPGSCVVANFPGTTKPWTSISKGGNTTCQFDSKRTDWKTRITGSCGRCKTEHCSARFSVMFDCRPPATEERRAPGPAPSTAR